MVEIESQAGAEAAAQVTAEKEIVRIAFLIIYPA